MRFFSVAALLSALAAVAQAQGSNSFNVPTGGYLLHAGQSTTFSWDNKAGSTVTLTLRDGANGDLNPGTVIAKGIPNSGSYTWSVPSTIVEGSTYAIEISDDQDPTNTNFTPQFNILSNNLASSSASGSTAATTGTSSSAASSTSASSSDASTTASSSAASSSAASSTTGSASSTTHASSTSSPTSDSANVLRVGGGSLLAVALGFAVAL